MYNAVAMSPWTSTLSDKCKAKEIILALNLNAKEAIMYCVVEAEEDSIDNSSAFSCYLWGAIIKLFTESMKFCDGSTHPRIHS